MDSHQHDQRVHCAIRSHGSLDRQRNDRVGWCRYWRPFKHRREILRTTADNTNTFSYTADTHTQPNTNCYPSDSHADSNVNIDSNIYSDAHTKH